MFGSSNGLSLSDIAAVTNGNDGGLGNNGWWVLIILFALFGGWGRGGYGNEGGSANPYGGGGIGFSLGVPATQADVFNQTLISKLDGNTYGIADASYALNNAITAGFNAAESANATRYASTMTAINDCCCQNREAIAQVRYDMAMGQNNTNVAINQAAQQIMQNDNANYRQLHDEIVAIQMSAKDDKIAELTAQIQALSLRASQTDQNAYLIGQLKQCPVPAYVVPNPYTYSNGCNCGGCN